MEDIRYLMEKRYKVVCPACNEVSYACKSLLMFRVPECKGYADCPHCGQQMSMTFIEEKQEFDAERMEDFIKRQEEHRWRTTGNRVQSSESIPYDYVTFRHDGNLAFGVEQLREGGDTLTPEFVFVDSDGMLTPGTYEDYFEQSRRYLEKIREDNPMFYTRIKAEATEQYRKFFKEFDDSKDTDGSRREGGEQA